MKDIMGGNFHAPIDLAFKRVLENGCGAGDWTVVSGCFFAFFTCCTEGRKGVAVHDCQQDWKGTRFFFPFFGFLVVGEHYMPAALISNLRGYIFLRSVGAGMIFRCFPLYLSIVHLN